jgi:hypothetical protein
MPTTLVSSTVIAQPCRSGEQDQKQIDGLALTLNRDGQPRGGSPAI